MVREFTAMPRAIVNFDLLDGVISAKPVDDQQELIISMTLDPAFAYRFLELTVALTQNVAQNWQRFGYLELTNAIRNLVAGATQRHLIQNEVLTQVPQGGNQWITHHQAPGNMPRYVVQATAQQSAPVITFKATDQAAAVATAGVVKFHCAWMEFDIEQAERFPIHWPALTYPR